MKRKIAVLLFFISFVLILSSCGNDAGKRAYENNIKIQNHNISQSP